MEEKGKLTKAISQLLGNIKTNYPELYTTFEEAPVKMTSSPNEELKTEELRDYFETLKVRLKTHIESHQKFKPLTKEEVP